MLERQRQNILTAINQSRSDGNHTFGNIITYDKTGSVKDRTFIRLDDLEKMCELIAENDKLAESPTDGER